MFTVKSKRNGVDLSVESTRYPERCGLGGAPHLRCFLPKGGVFYVPATGDDGKSATIDGIPVRGKKGGWTPEFNQTERDAREREARGEAVQADETSNGSEVSFTPSDSDSEGMADPHADDAESSDDDEGDFDLDDVDGHSNGSREPDEEEDDDEGELDGVSV